MVKGESLNPRIRIRAPLRCDGIGRLDCAEDAESGGRLAVRWLPLEANGDAAVKACAKLPQHPQLPRILQTGQVGGSAFVAMDFPEGVLLSTRVGERLEVHDVIRLGAQLSSALATVHAQGVVHGELSCESVLLVEPDHAFLWDIPLVVANRLTDRRGENRLMQNLVKTAPFLAPERARGEGASQASDVYALGAVLCVAAGAPLPVASTTLAVVHQVATGKWTPRVPMVLPEPYRSTLALMVSADPAERPPADEVAAIFAEPPPAASLPTVPEFPVVKLPPELLAAADALLRRPSSETPAVPSDSARAHQAPAAHATPAELADTVRRAAVARPEGTAGDSELTAVAPAAEVVPLPASPEPSTSGPTPVSAARRSDAAAETSGLPVDPAGSEKPFPSGPEAAAPEAGPGLASAMPAQRKPDQPSASESTGSASTVAAAVVPGAVLLTDTISVAHELAQGAMTLSADEVRALQRSQWQVIFVAAGLGGAILALMVVAFFLATAHTTPRPLPVPRPAVVEQPTHAPVDLPAQQIPALDDDLAPLPQLDVAPRPTAAPKSSPRPLEVRGTVRPPAAKDLERAPGDDTVPSQPFEPQDFGFLDSSAEAPAGELKRPSM